MTTDRMTNRTFFSMHCDHIVVMIQHNGDIVIKDRAICAAINFADLVTWSGSKEFFTVYSNKHEQKCT